MGYTHSVRFSKTLLAILGLFLPFVMGSQTFGTTEIQLFDTDFLQAPYSPVMDALSTPQKTRLPAWQTVTEPWSFSDTLVMATADLQELLR